MAVDPAHRRCGVAARLIGELEARFAALGCPRVNLLVMPDNVEALRFGRHSDTCRYRTCCVPGQ
ncbi:MAG TPA: GNAT family N-acetyltransferase [Micromonosporaceae bacterium]|nr:GNAT family N-acetyltransferase [Micromonosporaceae bacterium]